MRITCPNCAAAYQVPDHLLDGERIVRCKRCQESWVPPPAEPAFEPEPVAPEPAVTTSPEPPPPRPEPPPMIIPPGEFRPPQPPRPSFALPAAWAASIVLVIGGLSLLAIEHRPLAAAWPPLERLYGALGLQG